jgi:HKD family nuclease
MATIINNSNGKNHHTIISELLDKSDELVIASPFLSPDIGGLLDLSKHKIGKVTIITNLNGFDQDYAVITALSQLFDYCQQHSIELHTYVDKLLHGKVYLFYKNRTPIGIVLSSANLTTNGLELNHEYGIELNDSEKQEELLNLLIDDSQELSISDIQRIKTEADLFVNNNPKPKEVFRAKIPIKNKPVRISEYTQFFIKQISVSGIFSEWSGMERDIHFSTKKDLQQLKSVMY